MTEVREVAVGGDLPRLVHPDWRERFPWLVQGITLSEDGAVDPSDLALFGIAPVGEVMGRWERLSRAVGMPRLVHGHQVHGSRVSLHPDGPPGLLVVPATDGHVTRVAGVLLTVATADCVAVSIVDPETPAVALLHAGWRGAAAGILERGIAAMVDRLGSDPGHLHLHLGPAICGSCYEVGPEVHRALGLDEPPGAEPVDLRRVLATRAGEAGVEPQRITRSSLCTLCSEAPLFSHRGGSSGRQLTILGLRPEEPA